MSVDGRRDLRIDLRCSLGPWALLGKVIAAGGSARVTSDNRLEIARRDCTKVARHTNPAVLHVTHGGQRDRRSGQGRRHRAREYGRCRSADTSSERRSRLRIPCPVKEFVMATPTLIIESFSVIHAATLT